MQTPIKKIIDGDQYTICLLPTTQGWNLFVKILRFLGVPVGLSMGNNFNIDMTLDDIFRDFNIGRIVSELCGRINEDETDLIIKTLLSQVLIKDKGTASEVFEEHFAGRYKHLLKVVLAAMEVNYADFFGGKLDLQSLLKGRASIKDSATSIGSSGDQS